MKYRRRAGGILLAAALLMAGATGCQPSDAPPTITASRALFPVFSTDITDYVNRCYSGSSTTITVDTPAGTEVSVAGSAPRSGKFSVAVPQFVGRRFIITVTKDLRTTSHSVRCLPSDFPRWAVTRTRAPQAEFYATLPFAFPNPGSYPTIYDDHGVPIWWGPKTNGLNATYLPDGNLAWSRNNGFEEHRFDGSLVRTYSTVGAPADFHELLVLPNGNHVMATAQDRPNTDLSSWGGPANATIVNHVIQEINPAGQVVWSWDTFSHIPVSETTRYWQLQQLANPGGPFSPSYDPYHFNSVAPSGDGYVVSFRHLDAVYQIRRSTGAIGWKFGGSLRVESLAPVDDVVAGGGVFAGQHDARMLSDGTLTVFDDGTGRRAPRAVAYRLDLTRRRATLLDQITDPVQTVAGCCGSARLTPRGNYVIAWGDGGTKPADFTEATPAGTRIFSIRFPTAISYRVEPIPFNTINRDVLRQGMDAQYPVQP
ncbi:MAG: arylsulfotransferase family protein [Acidimicrobiales bacterium]